MKNICSLLLLMLIFTFLSSILFCSCHVSNMEDWPKLDFNLDIEYYDKISLEYHHVGTPSDHRPLDKNIYFFGTSHDKEIINSIYSTINGLSYSKKSFDKIDTVKYIDKVVIQLIKNGEIKFVFSFYAYGVKNGFFVFDNGEIHQYHGDFVGLTYCSFKNFLNQEEI